MGLTTWEGAPDGKILKTDVSIAKNYLTSEELESLGKIVNAYLELAEERAKRKIPMTMEDWATRLDKFLEFDDRVVLKDAGKISAKIAKDHAESEFERYRIIQDKLFESDFDRETKALEKQIVKNESEGS
uniref:Virulence protein RhuM family protein n=1 Tax=Candidatus Berkiella cookevillensis TaxID=437022 RepID=A0A0Q9YC36_9GAMM|nr:RhuM family protein [Candidatus Berkiella cookevillensis]